MQINRLFEIVYILLDKKTVTSSQLAERFEVSTRTIYRDVETLSAVGIPIYMKKGKGGGISLLPNFVLNKAVITDAEKEDILSSLKAIEAIDLSQTETTLNKLSSLLGEAKNDWIEVDFSAWSNTYNEKEVFNCLKSAIIHKQVVEFFYSSAKKETTLRRVEPLKLCFKGGAWYLYGFCREREDVRFFKLRRIKDLSPSQEHFQRMAPQKIFVEKEVFQEPFIKLKLKLSKEVAYRVFDEFEVYEQQADGSYIVELNYPRGEWVFYYVVSFGKHCEVLEPDYVRQEIQEELTKMLEKYNKKNN